MEEAGAGGRAGIFEERALEGIFEERALEGTFEERGLEGIFEERAAGTGGSDAPSLSSSPRGLISSPHPQPRCWGRRSTPCSHRPRLAPS